jgi:hypothetical protein
MAQGIGLRDDMMVGIRLDLRRGWLRFGHHSIP